MPTLTSDAVLPIDTKVLREAIAALLEVLREATVPGEGETVRISLSGRAPTTFRQLVESLPADADAEFIVQDEPQQKTASEVIPFLAPKARLFVLYSGPLPDHRSAADAVEFLAGLLDGAPAGESRGLSCSVYVAGLTFRGAPRGATGLVHLSDMSAFKRKTRFSLDAQVTFEGASAKDPSARAAVRALSAASSLPFREKLLEVSDAPTPSERNGVAALCIEEAFAEAASRFGWNHAGWRAVPGFRVDTSAPMGESAAVPKERVNFAAVVKRVLREALPSLSPVGSASDPEFRLPLTEELELTLTFQRERGLGVDRRYSPAFTIRVTDGPSRGVFARMAMSELWQMSEQYFWLSYSASADLESQLRRVAPLIAEALDAIAAVVRARLSPLPELLPDDGQRQGAITAREGLATAVEVATGVVEDATVLECVGSYSRASARHGVGGPGLGVDGRVATHAVWFYAFGSPTTDLGVMVTVPAFGRPRASVRWRMRQALGRDWLDSDEALRRAEASGGTAARAAAPNTWEITASLGSDVNTPTVPRWRVQYLLQAGERGRENYQIEVDAS